MDEMRNQEYRSKETRDILCQISSRVSALHFVNNANPVIVLSDYMIPQITTRPGTVNFGFSLIFVTAN